MRILLVSVNRASAPYAVAPLGISYIAGAARADGHEVALLDLCFSQDVAADIAQALHRSPPELIGVSIRNVDNLTYPASVSYLDEIRAAVAALRMQSSVSMVLGGPGFSIFPERMLALLGVEFGVIGEGEETFCLLARYLAGGGEVPDLPNLVRHGGDARRITRRAAPFAGNGRPARDLLDNPGYLALGGMANLQTKRGCPFRCAYCTYPHIDGGSLRLRPPTDVVAELASMVEESGLDEVFFVDDIFTWPPDHALGICEEIERRGLRVGWTCFATPLGMTPDLARAMKRAGCRGVEFGTDTASPRLLRALGKPFPQDQIGAATRACREADLPDAHYLIFGGPGRPWTRWRRRLPSSTSSRRERSSRSSASGFIHTPLFTGWRFPTASSARATISSLPGSTSLRRSARRRCRPQSVCMLRTARTGSCPGWASGRTRHSSRRCGGWDVAVRCGIGCKANRWGGWPCAQPWGPASCCGGSASCAPPEGISGKD